jgi:hypothetical protein
MLLSNTRNSQLLDQSCCNLMFKLLNDNQVKRIERFDEFEEMVQREIVEDVEKVERAKTEDRDCINRYVSF